MLKRQRFIILITSLMISLFWVASASASATNISPSIAQSYNTTTSIQQGMIVGLQSGSTTTVVPLSLDNVKDMLGVAISSSEAPLTLSGNSSQSQVYVATQGRYDVQVSNQNGPIHSGDYISVSSLNGIGMEASTNESTVLGRADAAFNGTTNVDSTVTLKNNTGGTVKVAIGIIPVSINIGGNPSQGNGIGHLPGFLQTAGNDIANKTVSPGRIWVSLAILLLTVILVGTLLYSGVRNSLVSIGRNPLARLFIVRGLFQVVITGVIIFIIGLLAVYLLLKL